MNYADWYTDTVDIYRVTATQDGSLTRHTRTLMQSGVRCRIYREKTHVMTFTQTDAQIRQGMLLACDNSVDIRPGDELIVHRGGGLGHTHDIRVFAGSPNYYYEPFGAVVPGLAHQEIPLSEEERL